MYDIIITSLWLLEGAVLPVYAAGPEKRSSLHEGAAAGGGESSGETFTAERTAERQAVHGPTTGDHASVYL